MLTYAFVILSLSSTQLYPNAQKDHAILLNPQNIHGNYFEKSIDIIKNTYKLDVITLDDINTLLKFEKYKDLVGAQDISTIAEIAKNLNVSFIFELSQNDSYISLVKIDISGGIDKAKVERHFFKHMPVLYTQPGCSFDNGIFIEINIPLSTITYYPNNFPEDKYTRLYGDSFRDTAGKMKEEIIFMLYNIKCDKYYITCRVLGINVTSQYSSIPINANFESDNIILNNNRVIIFSPASRNIYWIIDLKTKTIGYFQQRYSYENTRIVSHGVAKCHWWE